MGCLYFVLCLLLNINTLTHIQVYFLRAKVRWKKLLDQNILSFKMFSGNQIVAHIYNVTFTPLYNAYLPLTWTIANTGHHFLPNFSYFKMQMYRFLFSLINCEVKQLSLFFSFCTALLVPIVIMVLLFMFSLPILSLFFIRALYWMRIFTILKQYLIKLFFIVARTCNMNFTL